MKKLIIVLLIVGCDYFSKDEGICVLKHMETNSYNCYPQTTESQCIADAKNNDSIIIRHWAQDAFDNLSDYLWSAYKINYSI